MFDGDTKILMFGSCNCEAQLLQFDDRGYLKLCTYLYNLRSHFWSNICVLLCIYNCRGYEDLGNKFAGDAAAASSVVKSCSCVDVFNECTKAEWRGFLL